MQIRFSQDFLLHTSGLRQIEVPGKNIGEVLEATFNRLPQLLVFLCANREAEAAKTSFKLNGEYIFEPEALWLTVGPDDVLEFGRDVPEGQGGVGKMIAGALLIVAAIVLAAPTGGQSVWAAIGASKALFFTAAMGASLVIGGAAELIMGQPNLPSPDGSSSATYSFSGIRNTTAPGTPVGIVYGKHRVGGHITSAYTDVVAEQNNYLFAQIGLCEGPIQGVSDVEINKRRTDTYQKDSTSVFWRYGTWDQNPVPAPIVGIETSDDTAVFPSVLAIDAGVTYPITNNKPVNKVTVRVKGAGNAPEVQSEAEAGPGVSTWVPSVYDVWLETTEGVALTEKQRQTTGYEWQHIPHEFMLSTYHTTDVVVRVVVISNFYQLFLTGYTLTDTALLEHDGTPAMYGFSKVENTVSLNALVVPNGVTVSTQTQVKQARLIISAPVLYHNSSGTSVEFTVEYRAPGGSFAVIPGPATYKIDHPTGSKSEVLKVVPAELPSIGEWEFRVTRVTADHGDDLTYGDAIYLKDLTEINDGGHIYPHTALMGLRIKATDQLSGGMPTITTLVKGLKVAVPVNYWASQRTMDGPWTGTLTWDEATQTGIRQVDEVATTDPNEAKVWTDNPVWCLYDLITNTRYGLGNYFKIADSKKGLMLANFVLMAAYCDERIDDNGNLSPLLGRPRFSLNLVLDDSKSAIEWLNIICASMRASMYYSEGCVYLDIDRPKNVTQLFNMTSIKEFSQSRASRRGVPNTYEVQFVDADRNYEPSILMVEDPAFQQDPTIEPRPKTLNLLGVTDERQVRALTKYILYAGKYARTVVSFKTGTQGLRSTVGDVIAIQHDVPQWGAGGRVVAWNAGTLVLTLSEEAYFVGGKQYAVQVSHQGGAPEQVGIVEPAAGVGHDTITLEADFSTFTPAVGDIYIIGELGATVKPFRVVSLKRDSDELIEVTAIEYNESLYSAADHINDVGGVILPIYTSLQDPRHVSVTDVKLNERMVLGKDGTIKTVIEVFYTPPATETFWKGATVYYMTPVGAAPLQSVVSDTPGYVVIPDVREGVDYRIVVASRYKDGTQQAAATILADPSLAYLAPTIHVYGKLLPPADVQHFRVYIDSTGGNYQVVFTWDAVTDVDLSGYEIEQSIDGQAFLPMTQVGKVSNLSIGMLPPGSYNWHIRARDTSGNYSLTTAALGPEGTPGLIITPPAQVTGLSQQFVGENLLLTWQAASSQFPVRGYLISSPATGGKPAINIELTALTWLHKVDWLGADRTFTIRAVNVLGFEGVPLDFIVHVETPSATTIQPVQIIDNNVLLRWSEPVIHSLPIVNYLIVKGYQVSDTFEQQLANHTIGSINGTFNVVFETQAGTYYYWLCAVDSAGNRGVAGEAGRMESGSVQAVVNQPPDFVVFADKALKWEGDKTNAVVLTADKYKRYNFFGTAGGWVAQGATAALDNEYLTLTSSGNDPRLTRSGLSFKGRDYSVVRARIRRLAGSGWQGSLYYKRPGMPDFSEEYRKDFAQPANLSQFQVIELDMEELTSGFADWIESEITDLRFDFGNSATDVFEIDWIEITGRGTLVLPVDTTATYQEHFDDYTVDSWGDLPADRRYGVSLSPQLYTAQYVETMDYGVLIGGTKATVAVKTEQVSGTFTWDATVEVSTDGSTWRTYEHVSEIFINNFRFLRLTIDFSTTDQWAIVKVPEARLRLDLKMQTVNGVINVNDATNADTTDVVNISGEFIDVQAIVLTPLFDGTATLANPDTAPFAALYDFVDAQNPTDFKVYLYDRKGNRTTGRVSWTVRGV